MGSCILNWTRSQFGGGRKPECPEKTLEVRLRLTETRFTYNIVVEVEGVIDVHYASLTSQGVQRRVFYLYGHPSRYQPRPTGLNFGEQTGTGVFPLVIAVPLYHQARQWKSFPYHHNSVLGQFVNCSLFSSAFVKDVTSSTLNQAVLYLSVFGYILE